MQIDDRNPIKLTLTGSLVLFLLIFFQAKSHLKTDYEKENVRAWAYALEASWPRIEIISHLKLTKKGGKKQVLI